MNEVISNDLLGIAAVIVTFVVWVVRGCWFVMTSYLFSLQGIILIVGGIVIYQLETFGKSAISALYGTMYAQQEIVAHLRKIEERTEKSEKPQTSTARECRPPGEFERRFHAAVCRSMDANVARQ